MTRRLFALLSVVSLLLFFGTVVLWGRSYWASDAYRWSWQGVDPATDQSVYFASAKGAVGVGSGRATFRGPDAASRAQRLRQLLDGWHSSPRDGDVSWSDLRPEWASVKKGLASSVFEYTYVKFPLWLLALLALVLPACRLFQARRRQRRNRPGLCPACGYDLRASPERCPECGAGSEKNRNSN